MEIGVVRLWDDKGFGFITTSRGQSVFVHISVTGGEPLRPGALIEFVASETARGLRATCVRAFPSSCPKCDAELRARECRECGFLVGAA